MLEQARCSGVLGDRGRASEAKQASAVLATLKPYPMAPVLLEVVPTLMISWTTYLSLLPTSLGLSSTW